MSRAIVLPAISGEPEPAWNPDFIGAAARVTGRYRPKKNRVQACNDLLISGSVAVCPFFRSHLWVAENPAILNLRIA